MESSEEEILTVAKVKTMKDLMFFNRYFFKKQNNKRFIVSEHQEKITEALKRVISGECTRLLINIAPRYGKTEMAVKLFIAYCLALNSSAKFIHLSYSDSLALDNSESIKDLVLSEEYQQLFPEVQIKKDAKSKKKWYTTDGGGVYATSAAGQVTGFGAGSVEEEGEEFDDFDIIDDELDDWLGELENFGGAIIIDDPIKPEDADYSTKRKRVNSRFDSTIRNRVNSRNTPIIVIMQRLHEEDLCGHLLDVEPDVWEVLSLPCIKEDGSALWPHKHTIDELDDLKEINDVVFERQYMQNPQPLEGILFNKHELNYFAMSDLREEDVEARNGFIDVADEGSDYHCFVSGFSVGKRVYIVDVIFTQENIDVNMPLTAAMIDYHELNYCRCESNSAGAYYQRTINKQVAKTKVLPKFSKGNKATRILMQSGFIKKYFYFRNDYERRSDYEKYMNNMTSYLKVGGAANEHDDGPDATAGLSQFIGRLLRHVYDKKDI